MSLISLSSLGITLGAPLFANLNLDIRKGDRLGLVAANGQGKSTLLRCLAGSAQPTEGALRYARNTRVTLMSQEVDDALLPLTAREVVLSALAPESREWEEWRADIGLDEFQIPPELSRRPFGTLSGGWQRMVLLARAMASEPDVLLMDEPTNHLDLARIGQLERWMKALAPSLAVVVASHDRAFLDAVTHRTLFLRRDASPEFTLSYSAARMSLAERDAATARRHESDLRQAALLRRQAAKLHNIGVNSGSDLLTVKTKQLRERASRIETAARPAHREASAGRIRLAESATEAKVLLALEDVLVSTPDGRALFATGRKWISPGDRIALLGANGTGKSRLLGLVARATRGETCEDLRCNPSIVPGICDQSLSHLSPGETPWRAIGRRFSLGDDRLRSLLAGAGFSVERQDRNVAALSGGQKARLAMLILRLEQPNFFLLDEPTNHLDIEGQEALEAEIMAGEAGCLFVSHDRRFVETVANRFWWIDRNRLVEVDGPHAFFQAATGVT
ncbi:ABC-F family ATP-binding cassette domain-containing protein [Aureimonas psammosilenae]|uniref:ABC-F family ATP-binding cassette domain-containing protein n=1 Tax=Aureimonas psammosilenae TaxID=2495496 RepID=UPI001260C1C9|nr:ABC-F family ATP-binding cassette domain-containing protein [Aureimonas psammosilenae]